MKLKVQLLQLVFACMLITKVSAQDLYTGVWRGGSDAYALYGGLTWTTFVSKWQTLGGQNLRLVDISTYSENGVRYYNGVWRGGTDGYALYSGLDWNAFVSKWQTLASQGLRLIDIETYIENNQRLYIGVWRAGTDSYALYGGVDWNTFVAKWKELGAQNLRLVDVATYLSSTGTRLYTGVWRGGTDGYYLYNGLDWNAFVAKWKELGAQNQRLISITSYLQNNTRLYLGVWRSGSDAYALWDGTDWESVTSKWAELAKSNLRMTVLETYESSCDKSCLNHVLMPDNPSTSWRDGYDYAIKSGPQHCQGIPGSCPWPSSQDTVVYRWPNLKIDNNYWARNSLLFDAKDQIFTLPFSDAASSMGHNAWLYKPGSWHHAIDYWRTDGTTFKVTAAAAGKVIYIGWDAWSGNTMIISHDVGLKKDVYRTIYMHLQNSPLNDCDKAWSVTVPTLTGSNLTNYKNYLNSTGCPLDKTKRNPDEPHWGKSTQKIDMTLLGKTVAAGQQIAWSGSTGPGGCGCTDGTTNTNTHLHIFFAHRDPVDNRWYFFDPYGIYSYPSCYPSGVNQSITTACARYPIAWKNGRPNYPPATLQSAPVASLNKGTATEEGINRDFRIAVSPNPSFGNLTVNYTSPKAGKVDLVVYDMAGAAVFSKTDYAISKDNTYRLNLSHLVSGVYYLEVNNNGVNTRARFMISK